MNVTSREVICKTSIIGFHEWPNAPREVSHLRARHRHCFKVVVAARISHNDRDIEFQLLQQHVIQTMELIWVSGPIGYELEHRSVEMMSEELVAHLMGQTFPITWIEIWEDGENGCRVEFEETD